MSGNVTQFNREGVVTIVEARKMIAILLDNMNKAEWEAVGEKIREGRPIYKNKPFLEISGNWKLERIAELKNLDLKRIFQREQIGVSMGALTHSSPFLDLSMRVEAQGS